MLPKASSLEWMTVAKLNEYLTVSEAAAYLGCSADTLRRYDRANKLPARRHPGSNFRIYLRHELDEFLRKVRESDRKAAAGAERGKKSSKTRSKKREG